MQTRRSSASVLGKRQHDGDQPSASFCSQLQTPEQTPNPKRARTSSTVLDGSGNKENIPPYNNTALNESAHTPVSLRAARALRRTSTMAPPATPSRSRSTPQRRASTSCIVAATPAGAMAQLSLATPPASPPTAIVPLHSRARALLRATCNDNFEVTGRAKQREAIMHFIKSFLSDSADYTATTLYISGTPGTGKTALINSVLQDFNSDVKVIMVNCMALNNVEALWQRLVEELDDGTKKRKKKKFGIDDVIPVLRKKCLLVLDEIDHMTPKSQALNSLLSLPNSNPSMIRLIGIANTHTLSTATNSVSATSAIDTLHFSPYTSEELLAILRSRLSPLLNSEDEGVSRAAKAFFPAPVLTLLSKKIASQSGDVRSLFEVLRGAIDQAATTSSKEENIFAAPVNNLNPGHVQAAFKAHTATTRPVGTTSAPSQSNSEVAIKVRGLESQARIALLTILLALKRVDHGLALSLSSASSPCVKKKGVDASQLHAYYSSVLRRNDDSLFSPVSRSEFSDLLALLEGVGLISQSSSTPSSPVKGGLKRSLSRSTSFGTGPKAGVSGDVTFASGVWGEEILRGLGLNKTAAESADVQEEELYLIWREEETRINKEMASTGTKEGAETFSDAHRD